LRVAQFWPIRIGIRRLHDSDRSLQGEVQHGFRGEIDLLALARGLHTAANPSAGGASNRRAFASTKNSSQHRTDYGPGSHLLRGILAAGTAFLAILIGLNVIGLPAGSNAVELQHDQRLPGELSGALQLRDVPRDVTARRDDLLSVYRKWRIQRGMERLSSFVLFTVNAIDKPHR